jgi:hypothetical protein
MQEPLSRYALLRYLPIEHFVGFRLDCEVCDRPFRSFRSDETHCGCCRHLKAPEPARA